MFRVYAATVRSTYLLMVVGALAVGGWALLECWAAFQRPGRSGRLDGQTLVIIAFLLA
jgi:hypothetical protein